MTTQTKRTWLSSELHALATIQRLKAFAKAPTEEIEAELKAAVEDASEGRTERFTAMLAAQATTLNMLFYSLLAEAEIEPDLERKAVLISMAVKARAGCGSAVGTLVAESRP